MAITSASTYSEIRGEYLDNINYAANDSLSQAQAFAAACRALLIFPSEANQENASHRFDLRQIESQLRQAEAWIAANGGSSGGGAVGFSFRDFRT